MDAPTKSITIQLAYTEIVNEKELVTWLWCANFLLKKSTDIKYLTILLNVCDTNIDKFMAIVSYNYC